MVLTKGSQGSKAHTEVTETTRVGPLTEITPRGPQQAPHVRPATPTRKLQPGLPADDGAQRVGGQAAVGARVPAPAGVADHQGPSMQLVTVTSAQINVTAVQLPPVETAGACVMTITATETT